MRSSSANLIIFVSVTLSEEKHDVSNSNQNIFQGFVYKNIYKRKKHHQNWKNCPNTKFKKNIKKDK